MSTSVFQSTFLRHVPERGEFAPPPQPGMLRALGLAVLAHLLLLAALTWGVHWKRQSEDTVVEAELWSAVPQQAAPRLAEPPPPTVEAPKPEPRPEPKKAAPPLNRDADIAVEREKKRLEKEKLEQQRELALKKAQEQKKQAQKEQADRQQKAAEERKKQEQDAKRREEAKAQDDAKRLAAQRQENLRRMAGLAGAMGGETATGNAQRSSGPSTGYAGRIRARIKPNIVFSDDIDGNPIAEVEVRTAPDGTIVGRKLVKASGVKSWDESVLKAIDKTEVLPRDLDGRVPPALVITFRPKD